MPFQVGRRREASFGLPLDISTMADNQTTDASGHGPGKCEVRSAVLHQELRCSLSALVRLRQPLDARAFVGQWRPGAGPAGLCDRRGRSATPCSRVRTSIFGCSSAATRAARAPTANQIPKRDLAQSMSIDRRVLRLSQRVPLKDEGGMP